jgi:hypothetical protein
MTEAVTKCCLVKAIVYLKGELTDERRARRNQEAHRKPAGTEHETLQRKASV